jgi:hypothetical protein
MLGRAQHLWAGSQVERAGCPLFSLADVFFLSLAAVSSYWLLWCRDLPISVGVFRVVEASPSLPYTNNSAAIAFLTNTLGFCFFFRSFWGFLVSVSDPDSPNSDPDPDCFYL